MKVSELIEALKTFPQDVDVEMEYYEEDGGPGYYAAANVNSVREENFAGPGTRKIVVVSQKAPGEI